MHQTEIQSTKNLSLIEKKTAKVDGHLWMDLIIDQWRQMSDLKNIFSLKDSKTNWKESNVRYIIIIELLCKTGKKQCCITINQFAKICAE